MRNPTRRQQILLQGEDGEKKDFGLEEGYIGRKLYDSSEEYL